MHHHPSSILYEPALTGFVYGIGPTMETLNGMAAEIARTDIPVLLVGESGTGKDAYAKLIHRLSLKNESRLQKINCAAFDPSQLFSQRPPSNHNLSQEDPSKTLYLDNVQELEKAHQRTLLFHLPDSEDADSKDEFPVRLISSADRSLESEVEAGSFRRELYFRLNGACLRLPALRDRKEDIPVLAEYFLNKHSTLMKRKAPPLSNKVIQTLTAYLWPGNIRELENLLRRIVVLGDVQIVLNDLRSSSIETSKPAIIAPGASLKVASRAASKQAERELIMQALERTRWNRKKAARELQISYKSLLYKIKQIGDIHGDRES